MFPSLGVTLALLRPGKTVSLCASREGFFGLFPFAAFAFSALPTRRLALACR